MASVVNSEKTQSLSRSNQTDLLQQILMWLADSNVDIDNYGETKLMALFEYKTSSAAWAHLDEC